MMVFDHIMVKGRFLMFDIYGIFAYDVLGVYILKKYGYLVD